MKKFALPKLHWFFYFLIGVFLFIWLYLFLAYGLAFILPTKRVSNSSVAGLIIRNQVWEGEIKIRGDVITTPGTTITIQPGTVIKVASVGDVSNFNWLPWHLRSGINTKEPYHGVNTSEPFWDERQKIQIHLSKIIAIGTKEQPIIVDSAAEYPSRYDINVIAVDRGIIAFMQAAHYRRMEIGGMVRVSESIFREVGECALCLKGGSPSIINNVFEQALRESLWIDGGSPRITGNRFVNLSGKGIVVDPKMLGTPVISNNIFEMPGQDALVLLTGLEKTPGEVTFNRFSGNSTIRIACDSRVYFSQNSIFSLVAFMGNGCGGEYTFGPNYWGVNDVKTILQERILNKDREFTVKIPTVLTVPPFGAGRRN